MLFLRFAVRLARRGITRRMVVRDDNLLRTRLQRLAENRTGVNHCRAVLMTDRNENRLCKHLAASIQRQHESPLFLLLLTDFRSGAI